LNLSAPPSQTVFTPADASANISTGDFDDTEFVALAEGEERPAPPTLAELNWNHYAIRDKGPPGVEKFSAATGIGFKNQGQLHYRSEYICDATWASWLTEVDVVDFKVWAYFDADTSWVLPAAQTFELLKHEKLHLAIAQYIMEKLTERVNETFTIPYFAFGSTKAQSVTNGRDQVEAMIKSLAQKYQAVLIEVNDSGGAYDTDSNFGLNATGQADWDANWQAKIDLRLNAIP
jgi:hypothetical protein